jgi:DNA (cytosine-5)-methyltransferase 1
LKPRILDLYCGAGGAGVGYARAGFKVVGVDIVEQPRYPFEFVQAEALEFLGRLIDPERAWQGTAWYSPAISFDAIHASVPCQFATDYRRTGLVREHENLIPATRELLEATGLPFVIENVERARPWLRDPVLLCGSMFDLDVKRHRLFEASWPLEEPWQPCRHKLWADDRYPGATNRNGRRTVEIGVWRIPLAVQQDAMGIDWMTLEELSEAIPPVYTEHVGAALLSHIRAGVAA